MKNKKYVLFDLDGTITDPKEGITNSVAYALKKYGLTPSENHDDYCNFIGPPLHSTFMETCNVSEAEAVKLVGYYREYYRPYGVFECYVYSGIPELLKALKKAGKTVLIATSKPEEMAERVVDHFNLTPYIDAVYGASLDTSRTEKAKVIKYALEKHGVTDLSEAVMIGDRSFDIVGGKENGLETVGVKYGYMQSEDEFEKVGADACCATVSDLYNLLLN